LTENNKLAGESVNRGIISDWFYQKPNTKPVFETMKSISVRKTGRYERHPRQQITSDNSYYVK